MAIDIPVRSCRASESGPDGPSRARRAAARRGRVHIVCGGLGGVMEAVARGARIAGGTTIGSCRASRGSRPTSGSSTRSSPASDMPQSRRRSQRRRRRRDRRRVGTLAEIGLARKLGRPVVVLEPGWQLEGDGIVRAATPEEAVATALALARQSPRWLIPRDPPSPGRQLAALGREAGAQARLDASASLGLAKRTALSERPRGLSDRTAAAQARQMAHSAARGSWNQPSRVGMHRWAGVGPAPTEPRRHCSGRSGTGPDGTGVGAVRGDRGPAPTRPRLSPCDRAARARPPCRAARSGSRTWVTARTRDSRARTDIPPVASLCRPPSPRSARSRAR